MLLKQLRLHNFMSHADTDLALTDIAVCAIVGPNGAGKSSLIEGIMWCLYGISKLPHKELVRGGQTSMEVELVFTSDQHDYRVLRRYDGSMHLEVSVDGEWIGQGYQHLTAELQKILGGTREIILQSVVIPQGQLASFIYAAPAERRDLIGNILGLQRFKGAWETAKSTLRTIGTEVDAHHQTVTHIQEQLDKMPTEQNIAQEIRQWKEETDSNSKALNELIQKKEAIIARDQEAHRALSEAQQKLSELENDFAKQSTASRKALGNAHQALNNARADVQGLETARAKVQELTEALHDATQAQAALQAIKSQLEHCQRDLQQRQVKFTVATTQSDTCPLCGSVIGAEKWQELLNQLRTDMEELTTQIEQHHQDIKRYSDATSISVAQKRIEQAQVQTSNLVALQERMPTLINDALQAETQLQSVQDNFSKQSGELLQRINCLRKQLSTERDDVESQIQKLQTKHMDATNRLVNWTATEQTRASLAASLNDAKKNLSVFRKQLPEIQFVESALAPAGIPLMISDYYLPVISQRAQELLNVMSDSQLQIKLEIVEVGNKKGIELFGGQAALRPIRSLSGGEQTRVSLALRIALSQVVSEVAGCKFDCLVIDEPEFLDEQGIGQFIHAIVGLKEQYQQIFVMSHLDQIKNTLPQAIVVNKTQQCSEVSVQR